MPACRGLGRSDRCEHLPNLLQTRLTPWRPEALKTVSAAACERHQTQSAQDVGMTQLPTSGRSQCASQSSKSASGMGLATQ